jgi:hypothetical protein
MLNPFSNFLPLVSGCPAPLEIPALPECVRLAREKTVGGFPVEAVRTSVIKGVLSWK